MQITRDLPLWISEWREKKYEQQDKILDDS